MTIWARGQAWPYRLRLLIDAIHHQLSMSRWCHLGCCNNTQCMYICVHVCVSLQGVNKDTSTPTAGIPPSLHHIPIWSVLLISFQMISLSTLEHKPEPLLPKQGSWSRVVTLTANQPNQNLKPAFNSLQPDWSSTQVGSPIRTLWPRWNVIRTLLVAPCNLWLSAVSHFLFDCFIVILDVWERDDTQLYQK